MNSTQIKSGLLIAFVTSFDKISTWQIRIWLSISLKRVNTIWRKGHLFEYCVSLFILNRVCSNESVNLYSYELTKNYLKML